MKRICLLLCTVIFFAMPCMAEKNGRNYIFETDFGGYTEGDDAIKYLASTGLTSTFSAEMGDRIEICDGALYVDISERSSGFPSMKIPKSYTQDKDVLVLEFDLKLAGKLSAMTFPQFGTIAQTWMGVSSNDTALDARFTDASVTSGNKWRSAGVIFKWGENAPWYHFKYTVDVGASKMAVNVSGEPSFNDNNIPIFSGSGIPVISFDIRGGAYMIDNIELYTMGKMQIKSSDIQNGDVNVPCEKSVDIEFTQDVDESTLNEITISGLETGDYTVEKINGNMVRIKFKKPLEYATEYTVNAEKIKAVNGLAADGAVISFTTEAAPEIYIKDVSAVYDGDMQTVTVKVANTSAESKSMTLFMAVYDEYNSLTQMNCISCTAEAESEKTAVLAQKNANGTVKLYLWNSAELMQPYCMEYMPDFTEGN